MPVSFCIDSKELFLPKAKPTVQHYSFVEPGLCFNDFDLFSQPHNIAHLANLCFSKDILFIQKTNIAVSLIPYCFFLIRTPYSIILRIFEL